MKFESAVQDLAEAVTIASRFVERRANLPVLATILLVVECGRIIF
jgi:DNA polymerase III sliding clamp (beta) subunit (PCNA family)